MDNFKQVLVKRIGFLGAMVILSVGCVVWISQTGIYMTLNGGDASDFIKGFQTGLFLGVEILLLKFIIGYQNAIRNPEKLKMLYVKENDERSKFINTKIGHMGFHSVFLGLAFATVVSGFFDKTVFMTLLGVLIFIGLVKGSLKVYYWKKY